MRRGRPSKTADDRHRALIAAWEAMKAEPSPSPLSAAQRKWHKAVEAAARAGILSDARFETEPAVRDARERQAVRSLFRQPGKPMTRAGLDRDERARALILKLCPEHEKWMALHAAARELNASCVPESWPGFLKLLDRLGIRHEGYSPKDSLPS